MPSTSGTYTLTGIRNQHTVKVNWSVSRSSSTSSSITVSLDLVITCGTYSDISSTGGSSNLCIGGTWHGGSKTGGGFGGLELAKGKSKTFEYDRTLTYASSSNLTCQVYLDYYSANYGPSPDGGMTQSFNISVPTYQTYSKLSTPTNFKTTTRYVNPGSGDDAPTVSFSWTRVSNATGNTVSRYRIQYSGSSSSGFSDLFTATSSASSGSRKYSNWSAEGATNYYRIRAEGSAGSNYYSNYTTNTVAITTRSKPSMSVCSASQSNGIWTVSWSVGSPGTDNPINYYLVRVRYRASSSSSWSSISSFRVDSTSRSYPYEDGIPGYQYQFSVVPIGTNYTAQPADQWTSAQTLNNYYTSASTPGYFVNSIVDQEEGQTNVYVSQEFHFSWSAASGGTMNGSSVDPKGYQLQVQLNNGSWTTVVASTTKTYYDYSIPAGTTTFRGRVKTLSIGGSTYDSGYTTSDTYSVGTAPAPTSSNASVVATQVDGESEDPKNQITISISGFEVQSNYNKISGYRIYYNTSDQNITSTNLSDYTLYGQISSSYASETFENLNWGDYYRYAIIAIGQYNGESEPVFSNSVYINFVGAVAATSIIISGGGAYAEDTGEVRKIGGYSITLTPYGGQNLSKYTITLETTPNSSTALKTDMGIGSSYLLNIDDSDMDEGICRYVKVESYDLAGELLPEVTYANAGFTDSGAIYYISRNELSERNKLNPIVQIKRGESYIWDREDNRENSSSTVEGIRLEDGELGYTIDTNILRVGNNKGKSYNLPPVGLIAGNNNNYPDTNKYINSIIGTGNIIPDGRSYNFLLGTSLRTSVDNCLKLGIYNARQDAIFGIGNGTGVNDRSDLFYINANSVYSAVPISSPTLNTNNIYKMNESPGGYIGNDTNYWDTIFTRKIQQSYLISLLTDNYVEFNTTSQISANGLRFDVNNKAIIPMTNETWNLGDSSRKFNSINCNNISLNGPIYDTSSDALLDIYTGGLRLINGTSSSSRIRNWSTNASSALTLETTPSSTTYGDGTGSQIVLQIGPK